MWQLRLNFVQVLRGGSSLGAMRADVNEQNLQEVHGYQVLCCRVIGCPKSKPWLSIVGSNIVRCSFMGTRSRKAPRRHESRLSYVYTPEVLSISIRPHRLQNSRSLCTYGLTYDVQ